MTGDGVPDFAAGAPGEFSVGWGRDRGFVRVYSGADASIVYHIPGVDPLGLFGYGVSAGGDVNGDGVGDFLVGAPYERNAAGAWRGSVSAISGRSGVMLWKVFGEDGDSGGIADDKAHAMLGDLNADGYDDWGVVEEGFPGYVTIYAGEPGDALRLCPANSNSTGSAARISLQGPISLGNASLALTVSDAVPGQFGLFFYGPTEVDLPFGNGRRCAGGELFRFIPPLMLDSSGAAKRTIDFTAPPAGSGPGAWTPGSTWIQQFWYRDPMAGGAFFNLSDALAITFMQ